MNGTRNGQFDPMDIPANMRERSQWVVWRYEKNGDKKPRKVPYDARTTRRASTTDPSTWSAFNDAHAAWQADSRFEGIGFVFSADDPFTGIDLDNCIDDAGNIASGAEAIVNSLNSYTERSPGGRGLKIVIAADKRDERRCKSRTVDWPGAIEIYSRERFFTVTAKPMPRAPLDIEERQVELDALCKHVFKDRPRASYRPASTDGFEGDDDELIERAKAAKSGPQFARLMDGDTSMHGADDSAADLALCGMLAFWTARDAERMDRLFRRSKLFRPKWDEPRGDRTYGQRTVDTAIAGCSEVYEPSRRRKAIREHTIKRRGAANRAIILVGTDEHRVIDEAVERLAVDEEVFQRGGNLVRIIPDSGVRKSLRRDRESVVIAMLPGANLRDRLTRLIDFVTIDANGEITPLHPPKWVVEGAIARGSWPGIRTISGVTDAPILRPDGTILQEHGHDEQTDVLYVPGQDFPAIPPDVDVDDAQTALALLEEIVCDFDFESPAHKAVWLASLLTPAARFAFDGPAPLFLYDANIRGAGKTLLAKCNGRIVLGCDLPVSSYNSCAQEMRKLITSIAIAGDRMVLLDNIDETFGNGPVDRVLTSMRWKDRVLGVSRQIDVEMLTVWFATGNNVVVNGDTARRVVHCRLKVLREDPEHRSGFRHPKLLQWVSENRPRLLCAALTILAAYCRAGRPQHDLQPFGSFEGWSDLVRESIVWVGLPDPCETSASLARAGDPVGDALRQLVAAIRMYDPRNEGFVVSKVLAHLYSSQPLYEQDTADTAMREALENICGTAPGKAPDGRTVGNRLRAFRERVVEGVYLDIDTSRRRDGGRWFLQQVEP